MYKKGAGDDKQGKDAGNRTLCPYRNFSQAIKQYTGNSVIAVNGDEKVDLENTQLYQKASRSSLT